jgi:hypothetical protein
MDGVLKVTPRDGFGSPAHLSQSCNLRILFGRRKRQKCQTDQTVVAMSLPTSVAPVAATADLIEIAIARNERAFQPLSHYGIFV